MSHGIDISVIIPIYNTAKYLRRCVDSVLRQQNVNYEMILVDDGSTDSSPVICDEYAKKDNRIHVIHKGNQGLGYARNSGLEVAYGEYIFFLDSDDWIPPETLESLWYLAGIYDVDIISFQCTRTSKKEYFPVVNEKEVHTVIFGKDIIGAYLDGKIGTTAWSKLYKKYIFNNVKFTKVPLHEDAWSMHLFLNEAKTVLITNQIYYVQYIRKGSLIQNPFSDKNFISIECGKRLVEFVDERYPEYHYKAAEALLQRQLSILCRILREKKYADYKEEYESVSREIRLEMSDFPQEKFRDAQLYEKLQLLLLHPDEFVMEEKKNELQAKKNELIQKVKSVIRFFLRKD